MVYPVALPNRVPPSALKMAVGPFWGREKMKCAEGKERKKGIGVKS